MTALAVLAVGFLLGAAWGVAAWAVMGGVR